MFVSKQPIVTGRVSVIDEALGTFPSVYFSREYGEAGLEPTKRWICVTDSENRWLLPLIVFPIEGSQKFEATSPYGYAGIFVDPSLSDEQVAELWSATVELLRELRVVSLFLRFAPFDDVSALRSGLLPGLTVRKVSETILVPTPNEEGIWAGMRGRARTAIRKAEATGLTASFRIAEPADLAQSSPFRELYESTMSRVDAAPSYFFPQEYYDDLLNGLGESLKICTVSGPSGDALAACLVMADEDTFHYHLSGSDPEGARAGANNLLIWELLRAAVADGKSRVHLGGGVSPGDSLYRFKDSFGGDSVEFRVGSAVIDEAEYGRLVDRRSADIGVAPEILLGSSYFPAFRATVSSQ